MSQATKGQVNRKTIRATIEKTLSRYCPNEIERMANLIAYDFNLSPYTVRYTYLPMFIDKGILVFNGEKYDLAVKSDVKEKKKPEKNAGEKQNNKAGEERKPNPDDKIGDYL